MEGRHVKPSPLKHGTLAQNSLTKQQLAEQSKHDFLERVAHSQNALSCSDLLQTGIHADPKPHCMQSSKMHPHSASGLHTAWCPQVKKSQLGAPPVRNGTGTGASTTCIMHAVRNQTCRARCCSDSVVVLHRFQSSCLCLHPVIYWAFSDPLPNVCNLSKPVLSISVLCTALCRIFESGASSDASE